MKAPSAIECLAPFLRHVAGRLSPRRYYVNTLPKGTM